MSNSQDFCDVIKSIGAFAEAAAIYYQTLIDHKVPEKRAAYITGKYIKGMLQAGSGQQQED